MPDSALPAPNENGTNPKPPARKKRDAAFYWYLGGGVIPGVASALAVRFLVELLSTEEFGIWGYYKAIGAALIPVLTLSLPAAMMRMYFDHEDETSRRSLFSTILRFMSVGGVVALVAGAFAVGFSSDPWLGLYLGWVVTASLLVSYFEYLCRTRDHYILYFANRSVLYGGFLLALALGATELGLPNWLLALIPGAQGIDPRLGIVVVVYGALLWLVVLMDLGFFLSQKTLSVGSKGLSKPEVRALLAFSLPLSLTYFLGWMLHQSDQAVLRHLSEPGELASYVFAAEVTMVLGIITSTALTEWAPFFYGKMKADESDRDRRIVRRIRFYLSLNLAGIVIVRLLANEIYDLFNADAYRDGTDYLGLLLLGNYFFLASNLYGSGITYAKKTYWVTILWTVAGLVNLGANLAFIPAYGAHAAAVTTAVAYGTLMVTSWAVGRRFYRLPDTPGQLLLASAAVLAALL